MSTRGCPGVSTVPLHDMIITNNITKGGGVLSENTLSRGGVSDPQNCKIQKVPGYFLKTKLGIF